MNHFMDIDEVLERFAGDREVLQEVVQLFLEEYAILVGEISQALLRKDAEALRHSAHTLKGSVSNFSPGAAAIVNKLELLGRNGTTAGAEASFAELEQALQTLVSEMSAFLVTSP